MRYWDFLMGYIKLMIYKIVYNSKLKCDLCIKMSRNASLRSLSKGKIVLGKNCTLSSNARVSAVNGAEVKIGTNSGIGYNDMIVGREKIIIGDNVMLGPGVCVYDHDHVYNTNSVMRDAGYKTEAVIIHNNVWIGANCIILKGCEIGENSVIAAGTVVKGKIPSNSIVYREGTLIVKEIKRHE